MNKEKHCKKAKEFQKEDGAYIHAEMKSGHSEIVMSGHSIAVMYCVSRIVKKAAEIGHVSPSDMLDAVRAFLEEETREEAAAKKNSRRNLPF